MNQDWQDFLSTQGAHLQDGVVQHFSDATAERIATRDGAVVCDLSQFGIIKVSGEEAPGFLQNMLSNDIRDVSATHAQLSSLNSPKGRMLATMLIWRNGADFFLHLPQSLVAGIQKKLSMYVLRAKVKIENASDDIVCLGLSGANAASMLQKHFPALPQNQFDVVQHGDAQVIRPDANRFQINATPQQATLLWPQLSAEAKPAGAPCWDWLNIRAGIPAILPQTQEQFVAQMANLDIIGGVNFKKGCYPGQEIVARMQYLGKLKRRMYLAHLDSADTPHAGDELFSADMEGQSSGMVVNAAPAPGGGFDLLAVVQSASRETRTVHWKSLQGGSLQFLPLPYPLPQN